MRLPRTGFEKFANNPVEQKFWGRVPLYSAFSAFYYSHDYAMAKLIHQFKYHRNRELAVTFGRMIGQMMKVRNFPADYDFLVPIPLHKARLASRGYNQSTLIAQGISEVTGMPINESILVRVKNLSSQTKKNAVKRWESASISYSLGDDPDKWNGVRLLLIDDVLTTGSTIEACSNALKPIRNLRLGLVTVCCAQR